MCIRQGPHVKQVVASGASDAINALDVVRCMHLGGGIKTTCLQIILDRHGRQQHLKEGALNNVAIRSMAYRKFEYFPTHVSSEVHQDTPLPEDWIGVRFFNMHSVDLGNLCLARP